MGKPENLDKLILAIMATVISVIAWSLIIAGSCIPRWARPLNTSHSDANTTFSLWGREDCYGVICNTRYRMDSIKEERSYFENGKKNVIVSHREERVPIVTCVEANYCNTTWFHDIDSNEVPSLLFISRAFIIPAFVAGFITIILYIAKIVMLVLRPLWRRIFIRAAYLTFAAIAGVSAGIAAIIFVVMLEEDSYELLWAPALPGVGGFLFLIIAIGGYLSWRNRSSLDDFDDISEFSGRTTNMYEFSAGSKHRKDSGGSNAHNGNRGGKGYHRSVSNQSGKNELFL